MSEGHEVIDAPGLWEQAEAHLAEWGPHLACPVLQAWWHPCHWGLPAPLCFQRSTWGLA